MVTLGTSLLKVDLCNLTCPSSAIQEKITVNCLAYSANWCSKAKYVLPYSYSRSKVRKVGWHLIFGIVCKSLPGHLKSKHPHTQSHCQKELLTLLKFIQSYLTKLLMPPFDMLPYTSREQQVLWHWCSWLESTLHFFQICLPWFMPCLSSHGQTPLHHICTFQRHLSISGMPPDCPQQVPRCYAHWNLRNAKKDYCHNCPVCH